MGDAWIALSLTLKVAGWATALNLILGVAVGFAMARLRFPGRDLLDALLTLPMVMPPTVLGYYLLVLIGSQGVIGAWLLQHFGIRLIFTWQAAVIAATIVSFPLVFKAARAAFETVDPHAGQRRAGGVLPCVVAIGLARHPGRSAAGLCACTGRIRCHADGGRQHPWQDADVVDRRLRSRTGRPG
jgi:hypothetical protein